MVPTPKMDRLSCPKLLLGGDMVAGNPTQRPSFQLSQREFVVSMLPT